MVLGGAGGCRPPAPPAINRACHGRVPRARTQEQLLEQGDKMQGMLAPTPTTTKEAVRKQAAVMGAKYTQLRALERRGERAQAADAE